MIRGEKVREGRALRPTAYLSKVHSIAKALLDLPRGRHVLAVSGGRDSMVLLDACVRNRRDAVTAVATFDHGSGKAATAAADLVVRRCVELGVPVVAGQMSGDRHRERDFTRTPDPTRPAADGVQRRAYSFISQRPTEATWRSRRWSFLHVVAEEHGATIVTAHTRDDQAETVAMRILRGASARGLAGMAIHAKGIVRPLLAVPRAEVAAWAAAHAVPYVEDPSNGNPAHLRNRLRRDLLGALSTLRPSFIDDLCAIGEKSAAWRRALGALVDQMELQLVGQSLVISATAFEGVDTAGRAILWPEIAGRLGVALDRRGVARAAAWSLAASAGQRIPLSGGAEVERTARTFVVRRTAQY